MDNNNVALITKMVLEAVEKQKSSEKEPGYLVPVGVSARHIHLTQEHLEILFGAGHELTGACGSIIRTRISADEEKRTDGRTVCLQ